MVTANNLKNRKTNLNKTRKPTRGRNRTKRKKCQSRMSSWLQIKKKIPKSTTLTIPLHKSGFFSSCSKMLDFIIQYMNRYKKLPEKVNTQQVFEWYKPDDLKEKDIFPYYFQENKTTSIPYKQLIDYQHTHQYLPFTSLQYSQITPFIKKYFEPAIEIKELLRQLELDYHIDYPNTCTLFYRGNDKVTETPIAPYSEFIERAKRIQANNPSIRFLIQSDEQEFVDTMLKEFPNSFYFKEESRRIPKSLTTVDKDSKEKNFHFSKYYLAITLCMSKTKFIIFGSGNCSIWICLYRGNANGIQQYCKGKWV